MFAAFHSCSTRSAECGFFLCGLVCSAWCVSTCSFSEEKSVGGRRTCCLGLIYCWSRYLEAWIRTLYKCSNWCSANRATKGSILHCMHQTLWVFGGASWFYPGFHRRITGKIKLSPASHFQPNLKLRTLNVSFLVLFNESFVGKFAFLGRYLSAIDMGKSFYHVQSKVVLFRCFPKSTLGNCVFRKPQMWQRTSYVFIFIFMQWALKVVLSTLKAVI